MDILNGLIFDIAALKKRLARLETQAQPRWVYLAAPLGADAWNGDSYSDVASASIDLSAEFSVPAYIKAVLIQVAVRDSGAAENTNYFRCGASATYNYENTCHAGGSDVWRYYLSPVQCDANGDLWYAIEASGTSTLEIVLRIWGYYI